MAGRRVVVGLLFFPRGGSAHVCRYLGLALEDAGWSTALVTGSLGVPGDMTHGPTFFAGLELHSLDYTDAIAAFKGGASAIDAPVPLHPSYEDRDGAPDIVFAAVDPARSPHLAAVWEAPLEAAGAADADVFHLHHLTPQHDAVRKRWPETPLVAHLHGTEIKLIEAIDERTAVAAALGSTLADMSEAGAGGWRTDNLSEHQAEILETTRWSQWRQGAFWADHLRAQAARADHVVAVSPPDRVTAISLLGLDEDRVTDVPNGVDTGHFRPRTISPAERSTMLRHWLVEDPQGWDESGVPGSIRYTPADVHQMLGSDNRGTVLIFVGRFTSAKRVPLLVEAFARAKARATAPLSLLVWGGHPGEWEGEHPATTAHRVGADGLYFAGWRGHEDLPDGLAAADALVMPSVNDSYPQTPLEAMAVGLPVIATLSGGFPSMINLDPSSPTGWLVPPDDVDALADALLDATQAPGELAHRGAAALEHARRNLSWTGRVAGIEHAYAKAADRARRRAANRTGH